MLLRDLAGQVFGRLTVIERSPNNGRYVRWFCKCTCGNTHVVVSEHLLSGRTKSCGCLRKENSIKLGIENPPVSFRYEDPFIPALNHVLHIYILNAQRRNHEWSLSRDAAVHLLTSRCHYCGRPPSTKTRKQGIYVNGIDRIDNATGYIIGNVVTACNTCNMAKRAQTYEEFMAWIAGLVAFRGGGGV